MSFVRNTILYLAKGILLVYLSIILTYILYINSEETDILNKRVG